LGDGAEYVVSPVSGSVLFLGSYNSGNIAASSITAFNLTKLSLNIIL
jgi:hypothetical protein